MYITLKKPTADIKKTVIILAVLLGMARSALVLEKYYCQYATENVQVPLSGFVNSPD